jgi:hypothetical protein
MGAVATAFGAIILTPYQYTTTPTPTAPKAKDDDDNASLSSAAYATPPTSPPRQVGLPQTCEVCSDDILPETRLATAITSTCEHPPQIAFCLTCIEAHIHSQITSLGWDNISCPVIKYGEKLGYNNMQNLASLADFTRYDSHLLQKAMDQSKANEYQNCAHEKCSGGGWCCPQTDSFMICPACT